MSSELRHLRSFVAVAEELSFTRAAARLNVTQQSLSMTIKQLEADVGGELLHRTTRVVALTDAGEVLLEHARTVLANADDAISRTRAALGRLTGRANGGIAFDLNPVVNPLLDALQDRHPALQLAFSSAPETQLLEDLTLGRLDFVMNWAEPPPELDLEYATIAHTEAAVLLPKRHPLALQDTITPADLANEPLVMNVRWVAPYSFDKTLKLLGDGPDSTRTVIQVPLRDSAIDAIALAVAAERGIGLVDSISSTLIDDNRLAIRRLTSPARSPVELIWQANPPHRTLELVTAVLDAAQPEVTVGRASW